MTLFRHAIRITSHLHNSAPIHKAIGMHILIGGQGNQEPLCYKNLVHNISNIYFVILRGIQSKLDSQHPHFGQS